MNVATLVDAKLYDAKSMPTDVLSFVCRDYRADFKKNVLEHQGDKECKYPDLKRALFAFDEKAAQLAEPPRPPTEEEVLEMALLEGGPDVKQEMERRGLAKDLLREFFKLDDSTKVCQVFCSEAVVAARSLRPRARRKKVICVELLRGA